MSSLVLVPSCADPRKLRQVGMTWCFWKGWSTDRNKKKKATTQNGLLCRRFYCFICSINSPKLPRYTQPLLLLHNMSVASTQKLGIQKKHHKIQRDGATHRFSRYHSCGPAGRAVPDNSHLYWSLGACISSITTFKAKYTSSQRRALRFLANMCVQTTSKNP